MTTPDSTPRPAGDIAGIHRAVGRARRGRDSAVAAFALTVGIAGSAAFLAIQRTERARADDAIQRFADNLQHRSAAELLAVEERLRSNPVFARRVLRVVAEKAGRSSTPRELRLAAIRVLGAFAADDERIPKYLYGLRSLQEEYLAAEAVFGLARARPEDAARYLGDCLSDEVSASVVDVACQELVKLGETGRRVMADKLSKLSAERRMWLSGLVIRTGPPDQIEWLRMVAAGGAPAASTAPSPTGAGLKGST